ncbi:MAG TPA: SDR family NAD(P)-dependent oxidoreductase [Actinocrinis sp.]|jgi:NAD(P)-dependent dehydrogenase (short-subunit alcohol dehydrogenase family)
MPYDGESVLVTGATGGIGQAVVRRLAGLGFTVYAGVRGAAPGLAALDRVRVVEFDVADADAVAAAAAEIGLQAGGRLRAVVNNAGIIVQGPLELVPAAEIRRQFAVNVYGPVLVAQALLPLLRAGRGRIVNVSAPTARTAVPFLGALSASKAALESVSDALRGELAAFGIPVCVVEPGATDTAIFATAQKAARQALAAADADRIALYGPALEALERSAAAMKLAPVDRPAAAIVRAVTADRPKARYLVGTEARAAGLISHLPPKTRTRMVMRAMGLPRPRPRPAAEAQPVSRTR